MLCDLGGTTVQNAGPLGFGKLGVLFLFSVIHPMAFVFLFLCVFTPLVLPSIGFQQIQELYRLAPSLHLLLLFPVSYSSHFKPLSNHSVVLVVIDVILGT